jgi:glycine cleavage system H protein
MDQEKLKYARSHEWIEPAGKRRKAGISDFAQKALGDIVYVEFPAEGKKVAAGEEACLIESAKATSSVYAPLPGTLTAFNTSLAAAPEKINQDPFGEGWLFEIEVGEGADESALLDYPACQRAIANEG